MKVDVKYDIFFSERAEKNLDQIIEYLFINWSAKVKIDFLNKLERIIKILAVNPLLFQEYSKKKKIRKCLITKHNALYYRITKNMVEIITIHDTRRDISKLKI